MGRERSRVLIFAAAYVALVVVSVFILDWFVIDAGASGTIKLGLRHATVCADSRCVEITLGSLPRIGLYSTGAWTTLWGTLLVALLVGFQVFTKVTSGVANARLSRMGMLGELAMLASAGATAFLFAPEPGAVGDAMGVTFERTVAPWLMMLGHVAGFLAVHYAAVESTEDDVGEYRPVVVARPAASGGPAAAASASAPAGPAAEQPGRPPVRTTVPPMPAHLEKRLRFVVLAAELTRAGIDARREDGRSLLVMWRDVVGVIARRLPPELDGATCVDLVSTAGSTLRVLPWTRLTGEPLLGTGDGRARAFVTYVASHCPEARIDPATRSFVEHDAPADQIASVDELAAYDARLA
jgi:hypothetical protein